MKPTEKICSKCKQMKQASEFFADNIRKDCLSIYCKSCRKEANSKWKLRRAEPGYKSKKKTREGNASPYPNSSLQSDVYIHFWRFGLILEKEQIERIIRRLQKATSYWAEMDAIESELGCNKEDYDASLLEVLRQDRELTNILRDKYTGNLQQPVRMLSLEGEYICSFASLSDASEFICGHRSRLAGPIGNVCAGLTLSSGNYIWEFDNDYNDDDFNN